MSAITEMEKLVKVERQTYFREWRAKNKEKVKKHNENYWKKKATQKLMRGEMNAISSNNENN